jgi:hypothetical protein
LPQTPQLSASVDRTVHVPLQFDCPVGHPVAQASVGPASDGAHTGVALLHIAPQAPQFEVDPKLVPQPTPASTQSAKPAAH